MALPYGRKSVDHASSRNGAHGENVNIRARNVLLFRCTKLAESSEGISSGLQ